MGLVYCMFCCRYVYLEIYGLDDFIILLGMFVLNINLLMDCSMVFVLI